MKNIFPLLLGPLLIVSCSLHDTSYLQAGDLSGGQGGGSGPDSGASGATGGDSNAGVGGGATGGDQSMGCGSAEVQCASIDMIADFESNDGHLCLQGGGTVVAYGDGTGTQSPAIGDVKSFNASDDCDRGSG